MMVRAFVLSTPRNPFISDRDETNTRTRVGLSHLDDRVSTGKMAQL